MATTAAAAANNASQLSFDEFQAINARANSAKAGKGLGRDGETAAEDDGDAIAAVPVGSSLGDFLEMPPVQSFMVFMIVVDIFAALFLVLLRLEDRIAAAASSAAAGGFSYVLTGADAAGAGLDEAKDVPISLIKFICNRVVSSARLQNALESFTGFAVLFFALEMVSILVVFNTAVVGHLGYALDCLVVGVQLYAGVSGGDGVEFRLLSILRFWRLLRLVNARVAIERSAHDQTKGVLGEREGSIRQLQGEARRMEEELDKERDARKAVDEMLASYKDEVDTLNEALKIAAMDIAEVAEADDDLLLSDDEDDLGAGAGAGSAAGSGSGASASGGAGEGGDDEHDFVDASGSAYDKARNREALMREARRDAYNPQAAALRRARESGNATFRVEEDGSWDVSR